MGNTYRFTQMCWAWTALTAVSFFLILSWVTYAKKFHTPERPFFPDPGQIFIGSYDHNSGQNASYIYRRQLFGFGEKIRNSDLLIMGSSHSLFGISATRLGEKLSARSGHPVKVFNLALAGGHIGDALEMIRANDVKDKTILIDLFNTVLTNADPAPEQTDYFTAHIKVISSCFDFSKDWAFDFCLPRMVFKPKCLLPVFQRSLGQFTYRDGNTGDALLLWSSSRLGGQTGIIFPQPPEAYPMEHFDSFFPKPVVLPEEFLVEAQKRHLQLIITLVPYSNCQPSEAAEVTGQMGLPFIPISPDGLFEYDSNHLIGVSRDKATDRLFEGLVAQGIQIPFR